MGNRDSTLKGRTQHLTHSRPGQKQQFERSLSQAYLLMLESFLAGQAATGAHLGDIGTLGKLVLP